MTEQLTRKVVAWATEVASFAAQLPSRQEREDYLARRRSELVAAAVSEGTSTTDAETLAELCVNAARQITTEFLAQRAGEPKGHA